jgi:O-methyltransferase
MTSIERMYALRQGIRDATAHGAPSAVVQSKVKDTLPTQTPAEISLLRLDTDWYESARHELERVWDRLQPVGVPVIDDYDRWVGARKAVDEFFATRADAPVLSGIDYIGHIGIEQ